jgi:hypothetical protein
MQHPEGWPLGPLGCVLTQHIGCVMLHAHEHGTDVDDYVASCAPDAGSEEHMRALSPQEWVGRLFGWRMRIEHVLRSALCDVCRRQ